MKNKEIILNQIQYHDSFYLYDESQIIATIDRLHQSFRNVKFLYSIKTNSNPNVVSTILSHGLGVDAASVAEVKMGQSHHIAKSDIQYSAPGKTVANIRSTIEHATIVADSLNELSLIQKVAKELDIVANIGVRINPHFTFRNQVGIPSKFGIDETLFYKNIEQILAFSNIKIIGLHVHIQSQELDQDIILNYYKNILKLATNLQEKLGTKFDFINMGSGIGIPYEADDTAIDIERLGDSTNTIIEDFICKFPSTQLYIETGRYVIGKNGFYITKVLDKKISYGTTYVILNNTLNGFIRPCLAQLIQKYSDSDSPAGSEPLYTTQNPTQIHVLNNRKKTEVVTLVGNLCTATDVVATHISLPKLEIGDVVVFTNAGSYAAVLSPMQFSSQVAPAELFLTVDGNVVISE